jgi:hypothetical protein
VLRGSSESDPVSKDNGIGPLVLYEQYPGRAKPKVKGKLASKSPDHALYLDHSTLLVDIGVPAEKEVIQ